MRRFLLVLEQDEKGNNIGHRLLESTEHYAIVQALSEYRTLLQKNLQSAALEGEDDCGTEEELAVVDRLLA